MRIRIIGRRNVVLAALGGLLAALAVTAACGGGGAPTLNPISDQQAEVGVELSIEIVASDPDGDTLVFSVSSETIPDLTTRSHPPQFIPFGATSAYLRWTPLAMDAGDHTFTVSASDGSNSASQSFTVTVSAGNAVPVFRQPLGSGTTLDLSQSECIELDVLVEDPDSPDVDISLEEPIEDGYQFTQDDAVAGVFSWCPTDKQIESAERYTLNLKADDRGGHVGRKKYVIVLRRELGSCPGTGPVITHTPPGQQSTLQDLPLTATVTDDLGLAGQPVLYYSLAAPANPANPDFDQFVQLLMSQDAGSTFSARVPNPVLADPVGTVRTIYYFIEATDDDDAEGTCDHRTTAPVGDVYQVDVERPAAGQGLGFCASCSADVQCTSQRCVALGGGGGSVCVDECQSPGAGCAGGGTCSQSAWTSVGGVSGLVCLPAGGTCQAACVDDAMEDNDTIDDPGVQDLAAGSYPGLKLCGDGVTGDDEDFYALLLTDPSLVTVSLLFSHSDGDIDLKLLDENGATLATSWSVTDNEAVTACLDPGLYFIRVYSYDWDINADYDLVITIPAEGCCIDDIWEPSNGALEAIPVVPTDIVDELKICTDDEDWFQIDLQANDTLVVEVGFYQNGFDDDLDVYLYDIDGLTNLTPCCDSQNGQSGTSDEQLTYTVTTTGTYYVVVNGYDGSTNDYLISFDVQ
ncbi:MAG: pre-peptidase C-terminal domain-containing protein [bacterium]